MTLNDILGIVVMFLCGVLFGALFERWINTKKVVCEHKDWDCDTQVKVIECNKCKKKAFLRDHRDLFLKPNDRL